ncbi:MAG: MBL fold metallo-hydrolase [Elusimicrobia bacterium]|nr:MBL fold metallo-hydrolase [Elusimicrobiota bacterium]
MKILKIPVGFLEANCYVVFDEKTKEAVVIDPGDEGEKIISAIKGNKLKPLVIINTHSHFDHIGANHIIMERMNIKVFVPEKDSEERTFGSINIRFYFTPGHTSDGICMLIENHLFSGDTLFLSSIGRTDLEGGDTAELLKSIKEKILILSKDTIVHPGHGYETTVEKEIKNNPFLQE